MRLIVGLGNIGDRYVHNRHNVGFMVIDRLAAELGTEWKEEAKLKAIVAKAELDGEKLILAKPTTMMNASGEAMQRLVQFYKLTPTDVWVVFDDLDVEFGQTRLRTTGSSAGHNGVQSLIDHIGPNFNRLRVGISMNDRSVEPSEVYVLRNFDPEEVEQLPEILGIATSLLKKAISSETA
jgi:PTH1 family peptidyl-tRNA hydrolase